MKRHVWESMVPELYHSNNQCTVTKSKFTGYCISDLIKFRCKDIFVYKLKRGTFICAHAWIFFKLCMLITIYIQAMKMYLFNSITKTRTQEATLTYSHYEVIPVSKVLCPNS